MRILIYPLLILVIVTSCSRSNMDADFTEFFEDHTPKVWVDSNAVDSSALFFLRSGSFHGEFTEGSGFVEAGLVKRYFLSVVVKIDEGAQAMLMGWEMDELKPGIYSGEILSILLEENPDVYLDSGPLSAGQFKVELTSIGKVGALMSGTFNGLGKKTGETSLVAFDGLFNVERKE